MSAVAVETTAEEIQPWELHSELVLVSPEVCRRALELLPERDPDAFLARSREPSEELHAPVRTAMVLRYAVGRLGHTARFALALGVGSVGLAVIAELLR